MKLCAVRHRQFKRYGMFENHMCFKHKDYLQWLWSSEEISSLSSIKSCRAAGAAVRGVSRRACGMRGYEGWLGAAAERRPCKPSSRADGVQPRAQEGVKEAGGVCALMELRSATQLRRGLLT